MAITSYFIFYSYSKDVIHPVAVLVSVWFSTAAIASLYWGIYQRPWSVRCHLLIFVAGLACCVSGYMAVRDELRKNSFPLISTPINGTYVLVTRTVFAICLIAVLIIFINKGVTIDYLETIESTDLKTEISNKLLGVSSVESYLLNLFPFCAIFSFFELLYGEKGNKHIVYNAAVIIVVLIYCLRVIYSRGTLLYLLLGFVFIYNSNRKFSLRSFATILIAIIILMGVVMGTRLNDESVVFTGVKHIRNPITVSAYNYIAYSFENFSRIVEKGSRYQIFANVFQSVYKALGIYDAKQIISNEIGGVYNSLTWLSPFYDDLGVAGVIIYPSVISFILATFYNKAQTDAYYILLLAVLQKAIFIPFFGNYFLTTLSVMFPYFFVGFICAIASRLRVVLPKARAVIR